MDDMMNGNERISALADGQLQGQAFALAVQAVCADGQARATWHAYHLVGDVLRSPELASGTPAPEFLSRLSARLAQEQPYGSADTPVVGIAPDFRVAQPAANDGSFRWKLVAGLASVGAVAAVGWSVLGTGMTGPASQPQLAAATQQGPAGAEATVLARGPTGAVMIRDPKLDELLAAHRQFGAASALQMPAGFLRNATFDGPSR
jgi:sigma-E factor negative regulatory protein RseA